MNPGLVVKLRPVGPWRIGPDTGARNRVDAVYHSDTLYAAVTSAMAVLGSRDEWLDATARASSASVCFSSCFPFVEEIGFVAPPRTVWPPSSPAQMAARVRWKSARFVPLGIVQAILAGERLDDARWAVDGPSECLVPAGRQGPFRTGVRWNAAVDRLSGAAERHSTSCLEFRPGAGLWTVVSFADEAAWGRWSDPVKAAFRWLADSGFGGERSRGWGRSEAPEFVEGALPEMILGAGSSGAGDQGSGASSGAGGQGPEAGEEAAPVEAAAPEPEPAKAVDESPAEEPSPVPPIEEPPAEEVPVQEPPPEEEAAVSQQAEVSPMAEAPAPGPWPPAPGQQSHWLLSLYTPGADDAVDWGRGSYTLVTRGGRVEGSGELKKLLPMVAEGSVLVAASELRGSAPDVAPDGHAHPVFRAGFAVAIPLPGAAQ